MKKAALIAPEHSADLSLEALIAARAEAITTTARRLSLAAEKAKKHARAFRCREEERGYEAGRLRANQDFHALCDELPRLYKEAATVAHRDAQTLAALLAEQILDLHITQIPESLLMWVTRASEILSSSRALTLLYHPRLTNTITQLKATIPGHITVRENSDPACPDFILNGDTGGVEFAWRSALELISQPGPAREEKAV
jgi:hypothetical protein